MSTDSRSLVPNASNIADLDRLIRELVEEKLELPVSKGCDSERIAHRRLCLKVTGAIDASDLNTEVDILVEDRQHTKAAALALFQAENELAYLALMRNQPTQAHKMLAMAINGYQERQADPKWRNTCSEISKELTDPYSRAILAFVSKGNWRDVLDETTLALKYRIEVALRWLPDQELETYLNSITRESIREGDVEGILLTGLDKRGMDLLMAYINKFNDVQTAVLAMSHTVPRFIKDGHYLPRFEAWKGAYRCQISSWKLHLDRARFDVETRMLAKTWDDRPLLNNTPAQQISLVCNFCAKPLNPPEYSDNNDELAMQSPIQIPAQVQEPSPEGFQERNLHQPSSSDYHSEYHPTGSPLRTTGGTMCPNCGRHMPRCGVCSLWLGSPDPAPKSAEERVRAAKTEPSVDELMRSFVVFCINCNHGFHAEHAREWFVKHRVCPVSECNCICDQ